LELYLWRSIAWLSLTIWIYLFFFRGMFWKLNERLPRPNPEPAAKITIAAVIPARDEAEVIALAVSSLRRQEGHFRLHITVADDESDDDTAGIAKQAGADTVIRVEPRPAAWKGKLRALQLGLTAIPSDAEYILFTDADIAWSDPDLLARLLTQARQGFDLVTVMAHLRCQSSAEQLLIPAFVYFFFKLYPPAWVHNLPGVAAAAGGCMLLRRSTFEKLGGIESYRDALIDDCALARRVKEVGGRIWLGLSDGGIHSTRGYENSAVIRSMIARSAFAQLDHSALLLLGTLAGMFLTYLVPLWFLATPDPLVGIPTLAAWLLSAIMFLPAAKTFHAPKWTCLVVPFIAAFYVLATVESALNYWRGKGGVWKGRVQDP
jgi:hopene-associated glycosyltransferase HpnB